MEQYLNEIINVKKKVGILTFHWAANHGAVLQTYALSQYLNNTYDVNTEIINYFPKSYEHTIINALLRIRPSDVIKRIKEYRKEQKIKPFREILKLSKRYYANSELIDDYMNYDILITGSDQIWNPFFLRSGERKATPVYFLNFGGDNTKKISVSASFGCQTFPEDCKLLAKPYLEKFSDISVREKTGANILSDMGFSNATVTADPTSLLSGDEYLKLCRNISSVPRGVVSKMILRNQSKKNQTLLELICVTYSSRKVYDINCMSIPDWLAAIRDSGMVVTNSFHCVMMCLKFHTPFAVILENGALSGMNDRFTTLLNFFGLQNRIVSTPDDVSILSSEIDFDKVDNIMEEYAETLKTFLERNIR